VGGIAEARPEALRDGCEGGSRGGCTVAKGKDDSNTTDDSGDGRGEE
jgi:hypothetical protein